MFAKKKYMERNPSMAKILELKTKKGSEVIAKIAGTLSTANITSITSITTKATNRGVAKVLSSFDKEMVFLVMM